MGMLTFGGRTAVKLVRLLRSDETQRGHLSLLLITLIKAIIHIIALLTIFGYSWRYYFEIREYL